MNEKTAFFVFEELSSKLHAIGMQYEFETASIVPATDALPEGIEADLKGPPGRQLNLTVCEIAGKVNIVASIKNTVSGEVVYVRHLMKSLKHPFSYDDFKFDVTLTNAQIEEFAKKMDSILIENQKIVEILKGNEWQEVAFDWAGMR